ncbi:MAG: T9SS type A sorting domain-containing protein [Candidatus Firestonebacteria bacterium]|nr:T9SS type A sorting domain-containing protein [Candidatus Firestonebacteria bacterium]
MTPTLWACPIGNGEVCAYPNPGRGRIHFLAKVEGQVRIQVVIFNISGEKVARLESVGNGAENGVTLVWECKTMAAGIYFCQVIAKDPSARLVLDKKLKVAVLH